MPVPSTMADLSTLASSNSPSGSEAIGNSLDNYLRAHAAITRSTNAVASATIAAASTTDLAAADGESVQVTGSATITSLGAGYAGCRREVRFAGACTLTHSANLVLPNAANVVTVAGDVISFRCVAASQWVMTARAKAAPSSADVIAGLGFTPANKAGDTFSGNVGFGVTPVGPVDILAASDGRMIVRSSGANTSVDFVNAANTANAPVVFNATQYTFNNGQAVFSSNVVTAGTVSSAETFQATGTNVIVAPTGAGGVFLRPNGSADATGQVVVNNAGLVTLSSLTVGAGKTLSKISLSTAAPGVLADGELYLKYA